MLVVGQAFESTVVPESVDLLIQGGNITFKDVRKLWGLPPG